MKTVPNRRIQSAASCGLIALLLVFLPSLGSLDARSSTFSEVGGDLGIAELGTGVIALATGFLDLDQDGVNEAYFYSEKGIHYVDHENGELKVVGVEHDMPGDFVPEPTSTSLPVDVDNDGTPELVILGEGVHIHRIVGPGKIKLLRSNPRVFPGSRRVSDAAAGDFNGDGLPDIAVAMLRAGDASALQPGAPDMILMNRGARFEAITIEPTAYAMTQALTLADMDMDGVWILSNR